MLTTLVSRRVGVLSDVHQHLGQELERVGGFGPRRRTLRFIGAIGHGLGGSVVGEPAVPARRDSARSSKRAEGRIEAFAPPSELREANAFYQRMLDDSSSNGAPPPEA